MCLKQKIWIPRLVTYQGHGGGAWKLRFTMSCMKWFILNSFLRSFNWSIYEEGHPWEMFAMIFFLNVWEVRWCTEHPHKVAKGERFLPRLRLTLPPKARGEGLRKFCFGGPLTHHVTRSASYAHPLYVQIFLTDVVRMTRVRIVYAMSVFTQPGMISLISIQYHHQLRHACHCICAIASVPIYAPCSTRSDGFDCCRRDNMTMQHGDIVVIQYSLVRDQLRAEQLHLT